MLKRFLDIIFSVFALILSSPLFFLISIFIKVESKGPVFFKQTRVGKNGHIFKMFKFRKFPDKSTGGPSVTLVKDPRLTKTGKLLERFKLDELPQFINVLTGEMSIVGPRPETPNFTKHYSDNDRQVFNARPGIFGINQLIYRREASLFPPGEDPEYFYINVLMPKKLENDIRYLRRATVLSDIHLLIRCAFVVMIEPFLTKWKYFRVKQTI